MRVVVRALLTGLVALASVGGSISVAHAGVDTPRILLGNVNGRCVVSGGADAVKVTGNPGDSFRIFNLGCGPVRVLSSGGAVTGPASIPQFSSATFTLTTAPRSGSLLVRPDGSVTAPQSAVVVDVNVTSAPVVTPPPPEIHGALQQVGVPLSGSCADVPFEAGHYDGFPVGGWGKSWAMWMNGGRGGPVCTREIVFDLNAYEFRYVGQR